MNIEKGTSYDLIADKAVPNFEEWFAQLSIEEYKADYALLNQQLRLKEVGLI